jgi:hypothetical protein
MYEDSKYIYNLSYRNNKQKIDLICLIDDNHFYDEPMTIDYKFVNKLFFFLNAQANDVQKLFGKINKYLSRIEHKENIEEIYFNNSFLKTSRINKNITYLESLVDDYFRVLKNLGTINLNLNSLKKIDFYDDYMANNFQKLKLKFNLMKIFGGNTIVSPHLLESNVSEEKTLWQIINTYENSNTNNKVLFINFEYNSPYQKKFFDFFEKYINNNRNINTIIFYNFGMINYDEEYYKKIKSIKKIKVPELIQIFYDKNWAGKATVNKTNKNNFTEKEYKIKEIKNFFCSFFEIGNLLVYEGYNNNNELIYYNIIKKIDEIELERIFKTKNEIVVLNLIYENIQIKYERDNKHLIIIKNNQKGKDYLYNTEINTFTNLFYNFTDLRELTIDGFNYNFNQISNKNISSLNINILNDFSLNNCNCINKVDSDNNLGNFKNLESIKISGNLELLNQIKKYIQKNKKLEKIIFYSRDLDYKIKENLEKKLKKDVIILTVIQITR